MERHRLRQNLLVQRKEDCNKNIRDLGVLPDDEEAFAKYAKFSMGKVRKFTGRKKKRGGCAAGYCGRGEDRASHAYTTQKQLLRHLHRTNEALQKFNHVNKKAVDQYDLFTKQQNQLMQRKGELDSSAEVRKKSMPGSMQGRDLH